MPYWLTKRTIRTDLGYASALILTFPFSLIAGVAKAMVKSAVNEFTYCRGQWLKRHVHRLAFGYFPNAGNTSE